MATELAKAYVQIVPSAKGIKGSITSELAGEADAAGAAAGQGFGSKMMGAIKGFIATAAIGKAIAATVSEGAALQQSLGGIETLFKDNADTVTAYAAQAYRTAGLSANNYMETVTGFSASLLQGLGGDTQKAAEISNMAITDMADNSNKMGTSMESIQYAYQGFAKQNYTMLDNLKLGYGGTAKEMARLINESGVLGGTMTVTAETVNDVSFDKIIEAIHVVQDDMKITGTTAEEAAGTITGSAAAMKSAFQNVLGQLTLGQDVGPALQGLAETVTTFLVGNLLPAVWNILKALPGAVVTFVQTAMPQIVAALGDALNSIAPGLGTMLKNAFGFLVENKDVILAAITSIVTGFAAFKTITFITGIIAGIQGLIATITALGGILPAIGAAMAAIGGPVTLIIAAIAAVTAGFVYLWNTCEPFKEFWIGLWEGIKSACSVAIEWIMGAFDGIAVFFTQTIPSILQGVISFIGANWQALLALLVNPFVGAFMLLYNNFEGFRNTINTFVENVKQLFSNMRDGIATTVSGIRDAVVNGISAAVDWIKSLPGQALQWGKDMIKGFIDGIMSMVSGVISAVRGVAENIRSFLHFTVPDKGPLSDADEYGQDFMRLIADGIQKNAYLTSNAAQHAAAGIAIGIERNTKPVSAAMQEMARMTTGALQADMSLLLAKNQLPRNSAMGTGFEEMRRDVNFSINQTFETTGAAAPSAASRALEDVVMFHQNDWRIG